MTMLKSNTNGQVKTAQEWQADCDKFYADLRVDWAVSEKWERFQRILQIVEANDDKCTRRNRCDINIFGQRRNHHE